MKYEIETGLLVFWLVAANSGSQAATPSESCPISDAPAPSRYTRLHQIPTVAPRDDISHKIVTPGGMVLDTPKLVQATDLLTITARNPDVLCFRLLTFARDRHKCEVMGVARREADGGYVFRDRDVDLRIDFKDNDEVTVEPRGTGYDRWCEPSGKIDRATYQLETSGDQGTMR